jgi:hypothetical protein
MKEVAAYSEVFAVVDTDTVCAWAGIIAVVKATKFTPPVSPV